MKSPLTYLRKSSLALGVAVGLCASASALTVGVNPTPGYSGWIGYISVFEIPSNGGGYLWGSSWGTADLCATWAGPVLTLSPNVINDPNPYWYTPSGGPGSVGNKIMDASMYVEIGSLPGETLTFSGMVLSDSLTLVNNPSNKDANGNGWTSVAFIKDFAADYSSFNMVTVPLTPGAFTISLGTVNDPARHVQFGFETIGPDVWVTDVAPFGNVQVTMVPEPGTATLLGLAGLALVLFRRRS